MATTLGEASIEEGTRVYAIGDVHGCLAELDDLLLRIGDDLKFSGVENHRIIFIGDYVDRGPDCKGVVDRLIELTQAGQPVTCLRGNHEEKLINVLQGTDTASLANFFRYGGSQTLMSYGLMSYGLKDNLLRTSRGERVTQTQLEEFRYQVREAVGREHREFLASLELTSVQDDYFFCHAGVDPNVPMDQQSADALVWMREPFLSHAAPLEKVVVHGHTPQNVVDVRNNRINIDTGCVYGDALTAVVLEGQQHRFLHVPATAVHWS